MGVVVARCDDGQVTADRSIRDQVWHAADPTGETRALINATIHGGREVPALLRLMGVEVSSDWEQLTLTGVEFRHGLESIEAAVRMLVPRGWAVMNMQTEAVAEAVRLADAARGDEADNLLAGQWEGEGAWRLKRVCDRVRAMGGADDELSIWFHQRARLLGLAKDHHVAARYDASIPQLQMQLEGIAIDVTKGKKFFTKGSRRADLVDPTQLVSIEAGLAALQALYGQDVVRTQIEGSHSRHGVAHGRELAYDTRVNSAKVWSVMDAFVEWAMPKARDLVAARRAERQAENAGSQETDDEGRRVDDRQFAETRDMLRVLQTSAMGWYRQRGVFRDDLIGGVYRPDDFTKRGLPAEHGMQSRVSRNGQEVMYWRATVSGWVFGLAVTADGGTFGEHLYGGSQPPVGLPSAGWAGWGDIFGLPPDGS